MPDRAASFARKTTETDISIELVLSPAAPKAGEPESRRREGIRIETGIPFFSHVLHAMAFHGGLGMRILAKGDLEVDEHHLVEDTGLVMGEVLRRLVDQHGPVARYGHAVIPMDDALAEVAVDVCGRPYVVFAADFPQARVGAFEVALLREFFVALANRAGINVHAQARYGQNSHHMAEALFKALGVAVGRAYAARDASSAPGEDGSAGGGGGGMSTKGTIAR